MELNNFLSHTFFVSTPQYNSKLQKNSNFKDATNAFYDSSF